MLINTSLKNTTWIACLYFFQSLPNMVVATMAALYYQQYGVDNAAITLLTSLFMLPWCIKPVFAPLLEKRKNKKAWLLAIQSSISLVFFLLALSTNSSFFLPITILAFLCLAFLSSMNDILSDGLYLIHLPENEQKRYVGFRTCFYQLGRLTAKGGLLALAAYLAFHLSIPVWPLFFNLLALLILVLVLFHYLTIPATCPPKPLAVEKYRRIVKVALKQKHWQIPLFFIFIYNLTDAQIQKILPLYLLDPQGIGLTLAQFGEFYGFFGSLALIAGLSLAGYLSNRWDTAYCLKKFTAFMLPSYLFFFLMTYITPPPFLVGLMILQGQFIAGLMNGAYMVYLLQMANKSPYPMSMYTFCTSAMALSYILFGACSGLIQKCMGYSGFFLVMLIGSAFLILIVHYLLNKSLLNLDQSMGR